MYKEITIKELEKKIIDSNIKPDKIGKVGNTGFYKIADDVYGGKAAFENLKKAVIKNVR